MLASRCKAEPGAVQLGEQEPRSREVDADTTYEHVRGRNQRCRPSGMAQPPALHGTLAPQCAASVVWIWCELDA